MERGDRINQQSHITIGPFKGEHRFLSNFYPSPIFDTDDGILYPMVEHAFQAQKSLDLNERRRIALIESPHEAKREGRRLKCRSDWDDVRIDVMEECLLRKFTQCLALGRLLVMTGRAQLEEKNRHGDKFWGTVGGRGQNQLGLALMRVRDRLREAQS